MKAVERAGLHFWPLAWGAGGYQLARYRSAECNIIHGKPGDSEMGIDAHTKAAGFMLTFNGTWY